MPQTDQFVDRTADFIRRHRLLSPGQAVLAAVSGGADSVALTAALRLIGDWPVAIAHVNHGLREEAQADADFVADLAAKWQLPFLLRRVDVHAMAGQWQMGVEEAARKARYEALSEMAHQARASAVAVAHHADDQVETVVQRIFRGTHLRGLAGMAAKRSLSTAEGGCATLPGAVPKGANTEIGVPRKGADLEIGDTRKGAVAAPFAATHCDSAARLTLIRPLLWAGRADIEDFCHRQNLTWRTDHTNAQTDFTRNFIRHELLPLAGRINPKAGEAVLRLAGSAADAQAVLDDLAERLFDRACRRSAPDRLVLRAQPLRKAHELVAAMAIRLALVELDAPEQTLSQERFSDLLAVLAGELPSADMPGRIRVSLQGSDLVLHRQ